MIQNLTKAEADALLAAIALQDVTWEQDGGSYGEDMTKQRRSLQRAQIKVRQIAPEGSI